MVVDAALLYVLGDLMDVIRFPQSSGTNLNLSNADVVQGWISCTWIERYRDAGEFTIVAEASPYILNTLTPGTLISHINTAETMVVENQEIETADDDFDRVTITGRSFETILEQKIVGANQNWGVLAYPYPDITLPLERSWIQAVELINKALRAGYDPFEQGDGISNVVSLVNYDLAARGFTSFESPRVLKRGDVYKEVLEILALDSCGLRSSRPTPITASSIEYPDPHNQMVLEVHMGVDRRREVAFSNDLGDLESANYLVSNKRFKTAALVVGKWVELPVFKDMDIVGMDRRWMIIEAPDLDERFSEAPTGQDLVAVRQAMVARGKQVLAGQNGINISNPKLSETSNRYKYRKDYNVGDLVGIFGEYNSSTVMRVIEHVEIEDENGEVGYPTLSEV